MLLISFSQSITFGCEDHLDYFLMFIIICNAVGLAHKPAPTYSKFPPFWSPFLMLQPWSTRYKSISPPRRLAATNKGVSPWKFFSSRRFVVTWGLISPKYPRCSSQRNSCYSFHAQSELCRIALSSAYFRVGILAPRLSWCYVNGLGTFTLSCKDKRRLVVVVKWWPCVWAPWRDSSGLSEACRIFASRTPSRPFGIHHTRCRRRMSVDGRKPEDIFAAG